MKPFNITYYEKEREILLEAMAYHEHLIRRIYTRLLELDKNIKDATGTTDDLLVPSSIGLEGDLGEVVCEPLQGD